MNRLSELPANPSEKELKQIYTEEAGKLQKEFRTLYYGSGDWTLIKNTLRPLYEDYKDPNESEWNEIIFGGLRAGFEVGLTQSAVDAGMSGMGSSSVNHYGINLNNLRWSKTVQAHANDRSYQDSKLLIQEIIESGMPTTDPRGTSGLWWKVEGTFNGTQGFYELLIDPETNTVWHFLFKGGR